MNSKYAQYLIKKTKNDYNRIADQFSQTRSKPWPEFLEFKKYVKQGDRILDLGCGNGRLWNFLRDQQIDYTGLDISEKLIDQAKQRYQSSIDNPKFLVGDILKLPLANQEFDLVFCIATLHHIPSQQLRQQVLGEINRVLKPGGLLIMTNWNLCQKKYWGQHLKYIMRKIFGRSKLDFGDLFIPWKNSQGEILAQRYCHAFRARELSELVSSAGFEIIDQYYSKKEIRTNWQRGYNFNTVAKKTRHNL